MKAMDNWRVFLCIIMLNLLISYLFQNFILTKSFYYHLLSQQIEDYRIEQYFDMVNKYSIWSYFTLPVVLLIKFSFLSLLFQFPLLIKFINIPFQQIFRMVMFASVAISLGSFLRFLHLYSIPSNEITHSIINIMPLSLTQFIDPNKYPNSSLSVFNSINVFEILWAYIIYRGIYLTGKIKKIDSVLLVLFIWTFLLITKWLVIGYLNRINL